MFTPPPYLDPAMYDADLFSSGAVSHSPGPSGQYTGHADREHHHLGDGDDDLQPVEYYYPGLDDDDLRPTEHHYPFPGDDDLPPAEHHYSGPGDDDSPPAEHYYPLPPAEHHHPGPDDDDSPPAEHHYPGPGDDDSQPPADVVPSPPPAPPPANPPRRFQYKCVFRIAGCPFSSSHKIDWLRHVPISHFNLSHYWICTEGACLLRTGSTENIFMRKDIYMQHLRRGHRPPPGAPPWDAARLVATAEAALRRRYTLPEAWGCPAAGCGEEFHGEEAWSERMKHVAGHLEAAAAAGEEDPVDWEVLEWAHRSDVCIVERTQEGGWALTPYFYLPVEGG